MGVFEIQPEPNTIAECLTCDWWERSDADPNKDKRESNRSREKVIATLKNAGQRTRHSLLRHFLFSPLLEYLHINTDTHTHMNSACRQTRPDYRGLSML